MSFDEDLRARLVRVGGELLDQEGPAALSLREIARRAGVSHGAPRRHFPTHLTLLSAIARDSFARLAALADAALAAAPPDPRARLRILARVYLDFAAAHRGRYALMFRHDVLESGHLGLRETSLPLFRLLTELVAQIRPNAASAPHVALAASAARAIPAASAFPGNGAADAAARVAPAAPPTGVASVAPDVAASPAEIVAGALWANLHGMAELWNWGSLPLATGAADPDALLTAVLDAHLGPAR